MSRAGRIIARDVCSALVVLALLFLNFGHSGMGVAAERGFTPLTVADLCGDPVDGVPGLDANPCQACRLAVGLDVPPAPCLVAAVVFSVIAVDFPPLLVHAANAGGPAGFAARAPPAA